MILSPSFAGSSFVRLLAGQIVFETVMEFAAEFGDDADEEGCAGGCVEALSPAGWVPIRRRVRAIFDGFHSRVWCYAMRIGWAEFTRRLTRTAED